MQIMFHYTARGDAWRQWNSENGTVWEHFWSHTDTLLRIPISGGIFRQLRTTCPEKPFLSKITRKIPPFFFLFLSFLNKSPLVAEVKMTVGEVIDWREVVSGRFFFLSSLSFFLFVRHFSRQFVYTVTSNKILRTFYLLWMFEMSENQCCLCTFWIQTFPSCTWVLWYDYLHRKLSRTHKRWTTCSLSNMTSWIKMKVPCIRTYIIVKLFIALQKNVGRNLYIY